jgi:hypothetical protein
MPMVNPQELPTAAARREHDDLVARMLEAQQKLVTVSYDKAAAYTTVIIFGGYAGVFGLWQLTKEYLSKSQALWAALLLLVSLLAFVLFEVGKMVLTTRTVFAKMRVLSSPENKASPARFLKALEDLERTQSAALFPFMIAWAISVSIAVACALGAVGVLGSAFIAGLVG